METVPICLVCLKRVENSGECDYNEEKANSKEGIHLLRKFLKFVNQYLRGGGDHGGGDDNPLFSNSTFEKCSKGEGGVREVEVFCKGCEGVISMVCQLYVELLQAQSRLCWKLSELGKLLQGSREAVSTKLLNVLNKSVGTQLSSVLESEVHDSHVKEFRGELEIKCSKKAEEIWPTVSVERIVIPKLSQEGGGGDRGTTWPLILRITQEAGLNEDLRGADIKSEISDFYECDDDDASHKSASGAFGLLEEKEDTINLEVEKQGACQLDNDWLSEEMSCGEVTEISIAISEESEVNVDVKLKKRPVRKATANAVYVPSSLIEGEEDEKSDEVQVDSNTADDKSKQDSATGEGLKSDSNNIDNEKCEHCDKVFSTRLGFRNHLKGIEKSKTLNRNFHCCFCWRSFHFRQSYEMHMTAQHKNLMKSNSPFLCSELSCRKWFSSFTDHNEHLKDHSDAIYQCPQCNLGFTNNSHLELHQLIHTKPTGITFHSLGRVHCSSCSKEFGKVEQFQEHFNTEHGTSLKFTCEKCGVDFKSFLALCIHIKTDPHLPSRVVVPKPSAETKKKKTLRKHEHSCETCGRSFPKLRGLRCHLRHLHEYKAKAEEKIFKCCFCVRSFAFSQSCEVHTQEMHKNKIVEKAFKCDVDGCKEGFESLDKLRHHLTTHDSSSTPTIFQCKECRWPFLNSTRLQLHELSHIPRINGVFNCPFPNCKFANAGLPVLQTHFNNRHGDKLKWFKCPVENCEMACSSMYIMKIHNMRSHPEKEELSRPFRCSDCGRRYKDERLLKRCHRTWYHKAKRECSKCGEKFRWNGELWKHMWEKHSQVSTRNGWRPRNRKKQAELAVNSCPVCGKPIKASLTSTQMIMHLRTHQRVKERLGFICESCGKLFTSRQQLKLHIQRHEKNKNTPEIMCQECGKLLSSLRLLKVHVKAVHSKLKNYCSICSQSFTSTPRFKRHMEVFHDNCDHVQSQDLSKTTTKLISFKKRMCYYPSCKSIFQNQLDLQSHVEQVHSFSPEAFMCNLCGRTFANKQRLTRHSIFHTGAKAHKCEICGIGFTQGSSLKQHLVNIHGQGNENQGSFPCEQPNCKKTFKCKDYLMSHLKKVHKIRGRVALLPSTAPKW